MVRRIAAALLKIASYEAPGQGMIEYGLIIALVAVVAIAGLIILGPSIVSVLGTITTSV